MKKPNKNNQPTKCPFCHKGTMVQQGMIFDLRRNSVFVPCKCDTCDTPVVHYRAMTADERKAEMERVMREDEQRKADEAARAARDAAQDEAIKNGLAAFKRGGSGLKII